MAAAALLFSDLSLLSSSAAGDGNSSPLSATARALELGYAAVALDHPHRGLLADSHRCRAQPFPPLSSLPLPSSAALHRRRLASPTSEPFRQYTRITLSLDSPAAAASALAPSAARLLRTYDIVAARPLTQAAFDHLCQVPYSQQLDLISIDFSHKLPFRLKLPMLKLALQRGLHFEIAYAPFLAPDGDSRKNILADAKLLVDWTKGKNLIISSAAHTATQIRGPYDVINLCSYLLGVPMHRAKAAISTNCRSLISMALRKKHFYKETIRIDRLLPHDQLDLTTKFKLGDWIGWHYESSKGGHLQSLEANQLEPSSNKDDRPSSPIYGVIQVSHDQNRNADAKPSERLANDEEIPSQTQDETVQADIPMDHDLSILTASFDHQNAVLYKPGNNEDVLDHFVQAASGHSVNLKSAHEDVEFVQNAMEVDTTKSCRLNLVVGDSVPSTSVTTISLAHSILHQGLGLSGTSIQVKHPGQSSEILDDGRSYTHTGCASVEMNMTPLDHGISSVSDVCFKDRDVGHSSDIPVDTEAYSGTSKPVNCLPGGKDDKEPMDQNMNENIEQPAEGEIESTDMKTRNDTSVEPEGQEINSTVNTYNKGSVGSNRESDELKEQNSKKTSASLEKDVAAIHEPLLNNPYPNGKAKISTVKSEKRRRELKSHHLGYLPFLGLLKSMHFKKKVCKVRDLVKPM